MLRPERMSKVSVTGSKAVMPTVIETIYDLSLVHLSDYDGSWSGFENGRPLDGAEEASEKLVTVRSLKSILEIDRTGTDGIAEYSEEELDERLSEIQSTVNELDERRNELEDRRRSLNERIDALAPFVDLGIDLDLLTGYDAISVVVGEGDRAAVRDALAAADEIEHYELFAGERTVAIASDADADTVTDALVGAEFAQIEIPESEGEPSSRIDELEDKRTEVDGQIAEIDEELAAVREEVEEFLLAAEQHLTAQVHQKEVPLQFATSKRSFIAEGWIPATRLSELQEALRAAVGDRVEIEELERAAYDAVEGDEQAVADGGKPVAMDDSPPTQMDNPGPTKPFEELVKVVAHPKYTELDPTLIIFLTFPFMFGFMIGDIAYGIVYMGLGYALWQAKSEAINALGTIAMWSGGFTILFGYLYSDFLGMKTGLHGILPGAGVLHKGYKPGLDTVAFGADTSAAASWVLLWIVLALLFGVLHMVTGLVMNYVNKRPHGFRDAAYESISWILAIVGLYLWVFSTHLQGTKPDFLYYYLPQIPAEVGYLGLGMFVVGIALVAIGEGIVGIVEVPSIVLGQTLSYLRIPSVLLAKGGMAMVVLILTGLLLGQDPLILVEEQSFGKLIFGGGIADVVPSGNIIVSAVLSLLALVVFVVGHILVIALGITAAGIQMIRLEYVEFFQRFYEGGGEKYNPFGRSTQGITDE